MPTEQVPKLFNSQHISFFPESFYTADHILSDLASSLFYQLIDRLIAFFIGRRNDMKKHLWLSLFILMICLTFCGCGKEFKSDDAIEDFKNRISESIKNNEVLQKCSVYRIEDDSKSYNVHAYVEGEIKTEVSLKKQYYHMQYSNVNGKYNLSSMIPDRREDWKEVPLSPADDEVIDEYVRKSTYYIDGTMMKDFQLLDYSILRRETDLEQGKDVLDISISGIGCGVPIEETVRIEFKFSSYGEWYGSLKETISSFAPIKKYVDTIPTLTLEDVTEGLSNNSFQLKKDPGAAHDYYSNEGPTRIYLSENIIKDFTMKEDFSFGENGLQTSASVVVDCGIAEFDLPVHIRFFYEEDGSWTTNIFAYEYTDMRWKLLGVYTGAYKNRNFALAITEQNDNSLKGIIIKKVDGKLSFISEAEGQIKDSKNITFKTTNSMIANDYTPDFSFRGTVDFNEGKIVENSNILDNVDFLKDPNSDSYRLLHIINFNSRNLSFVEADFIEFIAQMKERYSLDVLLLPYITGLNFGNTEDEIKEKLSTIYSALNLVFDDEKSGIILTWDYNLGFIFIPIGRCEEILTTEKLEEITNILESFNYDSSYRSDYYDLDEIYYIVCEKLVSDVIIEDAEEYARRNWGINFTSIPSSESSASDADGSVIADENYTVGDYLTFGSYPQTASGNDSTPIEWLVLERDGNKLLLISKYGLDADRFNRDYVTTITWKKCSLREWLNDTFLNEAFSKKEQSAIITASTGGDFSDWNTDGAGGTQDKVFLLSVDEADKYFGVSYDSESNAAMISPTEYAKSMGAQENEWNTTSEGKAACAWWLRTTGTMNTNRAALVKSFGMLEYDYCNETYCVRPAMWVKVD